MYNELQHHGIKGQKWGVRRFQNPDGTLTSAGRDRYGHEHDQRIKEGILNRNGIRSNPSFGTPKTVLGKPVSLGGSSRYARAAKAAQRDADDLRKHGFIEEADAVQKVADKNREKAAAKEAKRRSRYERAADVVQKVADKNRARYSKKIQEKGKQKVYEMEIDGQIWKILGDEDTYNRNIKNAKKYYENLRKSGL